MGFEPTSRCDLARGPGSLCNMDTRPDSVLVAAVLDGGVEAVAALVRRYRDAYTRFAVRMLGIGGLGRRRRAARGRSSAPSPGSYPGRRPSDRVVKRRYTPPSRTRSTRRVFNGTL